MIHCPTCGATTAVVDTREAKRRRECTAGHRFSTVEIMADDLKSHRRTQRQLAAHTRLRAKVAQIAKLLEWADRA